MDCRQIRNFVKGRNIKDVRELIEQAGISRQDIKSLAKEYPEEYKKMEKDMINNRRTSK